MANTQSARLAPSFTPNLNLNFLLSFPQELWACAGDAQLAGLCATAPQPCSVACQNWTDWEPRFENSLQSWKGQDRGSDRMWVWSGQCLLRTVNTYVWAELGWGLMNSRVIKWQALQNQESHWWCGWPQSPVGSPLCWPTSKAVVVHSLKRKITDLQQSEESL